MSALRKRLAAGRDILRSEMKSKPAVLTDIPRDRWPEKRPGAPYPTRALWSWEFLVQIFDEPSGFRLSANRVEVDRAGRWIGNISWDDLMRLKREAGYADWWAMEIYPPDSHIVNVANMRHLWILLEAPTFGWRCGNAQS